MQDRVVAGQSMPLSINLNRLDHQRVHWLGRSGIPGRDGIDARTARNRRVSPADTPDRNSLFGIGVE